MIPKAILLLFISSALGKSNTEGFLNTVIDIEGLKSKILNILGNTDESLFVVLKMLDASSKIPTGLGGGKFIDLGNFDECYNIEFRDIYGKYCLGTLALDQTNLQYTLGINTTRKPTVRLHPEPRMAGGGSIALHFAACIPSNMSVFEIPVDLIYTEDFCYSKATEPELSPGAVTTIVILSIFGAIVAASTIFDTVLDYNGKKPPHDLLVAFSVLTNGRKILTSTSNPDQLLCLNGIKALSMMWVIIGHEYSTALNAPISNVFDVLEWEKSSANMFIIGATVSVDTFFVVGGVVTVYTFLKSVDRGVKLNVPLLYIHRYLRLTPAFVITSLVYVFLVKHISNGPLWKVVDDTLVDRCEEGWWSSLLYITNYVKAGACVPQSWYLSVDMQLFVLSPLVLIPLSKWPKLGLSILGFLTIAGCVAPFVVTYTENISTTGDQAKYMYDYYIQTYTRFGPYVIGMLLGYYVYQIKKRSLKLSLSKVESIVSWLACLTGLTACVYAGYPLNRAQEDRLGNSLFFAFDRPGWAVAVCGVILLCVAGYGGPVDTFLSNSVFQFLTKLSYSMYLVHYAVITVRYSSMKNNVKFSNWALFHAFWGDFMVTLGLSPILCLTFESPIIILEKYLFGKGKPEAKERKAEA